MNRSGEIGRFGIDNFSSPPGYGPRYPTDNIYADDRSITQTTMIELTKTESGYDCIIAGTQKVVLPSGESIKQDAIQAAIAYDDETTEAVRILKDAKLDLEVVDGKDSIEKLIGVVVTVSQADADIMQHDDEIYRDVMGAIGEACQDIESDRIAVRGSP